MVPSERGVVLQGTEVDQRTVLVIPECRRRYVEKWVNISIMVTCSVYCYLLYIIDHDGRRLGFPSAPVVM